jgi:Putative auto-transporter adhesin, head GIN domain
VIHRKNLRFHTERTRPQDTGAQLSAVEVSGIGNMTMEGVQGASFRAEVSGEGDLQATGRVDRVEAEVSAAGDVDFTQLVARDAVVEISGAGDIQVHATESLSTS